MTTTAAAAPVRVRVVTPVPRERWREVAAADPAALVTQSPEWIDAVCAGGRYRDASRLYETPRGAVVLPLVRRRGAPGRRGYHGSMPPAWGMGGPLAEGGLTTEDVALVAADLRRLGAVVINVRPNPLHGTLWDAAGGASATIPRRAHVVDLDGGPDAVLARMSRSARSHIRRAERLGVEVECDDAGRLVPVFLELFDRSVVRWAAQQNEPLALARWRARRRDPPEKLRAMARALGASCQVWVARVDGRPAAASIVLVGANAHVTRGAMDKELVRSTGVTDLLEWRSMQLACERGCRWFHMGESGANERLGRYKEKFGARPLDYAEHRFERLPVTAAEAAARRAAKAVLRFRDV